jgi:hypothetical protein
LCAYHSSEGTNRHLLIDMKIKDILKEQEITELFDPKYSFDIEWDESASYGLEQNARAYDRQGREINISFVPFSSLLVDVEFTRGGTYEITGRGDAERVFATVLRTIGMYINKFKPKYLIFSGSEESRNSLYRAMVARYAPRFGYELTTVENATKEWESLPGYGKHSFALERIN